LLLRMVAELSRSHAPSGKRITQSAEFQKKPLRRWLRLRRMLFTNAILFLVALSHRRYYDFLEIHSQ
jgi:hypothetical protein